MYIIYFEGSIAKKFKDCPIRVVLNLHEALDVVDIIKDEIDIEDDRVSIFNAEGLKTQGLVWEFYGWQFTERIGQGMLIGHSKTLYAEKVEEHITNKEGE